MTAVALPSRARQAPAGPPALESPRTRRITNLAPARALALPAIFIAALAAMVALPAVRENVKLVWSFAVAVAALTVWTVARARALGRGFRTLTLEIVLRKQHYLQACAQGSVLLYWGWYWRDVYASWHLLVAQLLFAYAFDILLAWSRRDVYTLGFGPFPVVFSINLFLWFKPDWFYLQFLMIAVGFAAKELIRWEKDGRPAHIFNPSSFPLAIFSLALILTGSTGMTWGPEIADTQFRPPNIYLMLFLIGLPGQLLFGVTSMTMSAAVTTYLFGLLYYAVTDTYFFVDSYIPIAVFLGMHLLFTDPSTSPRTELGRILFGVLYGLGTVAFYALLGRFDVPTFYDKLLPVPLLNLSIMLIDRLARSSALRRLDPAAIARGLAGRRRNLAYIGVWTAVFIAMSAADGVGDTHRGHWIPFWQRACAEQRAGACHTLALMEATYCRESGWACNDLGILVSRGFTRREKSASTLFERSCGLGFTPGCQNARASASGVVGAPASGPPRLADYLILLQEGKGPVRGQTPFDLHTRACAQGWMSACEDVAFAYLRGQGTPRDAARAAVEFDKACAGGIATACSNAGLMFHNGDGVPRDEVKALEYLKRACTSDFPDACRWLEEQRR